MRDPRFAEILVRYSPLVQPIGEIENLGGAGGLSGAILYRYPSKQGRMALRRWPGDESGHARVLRIHQWIGRAVDLDFIPVPIRDQVGASLQVWDGGLWELTPWLEGSAHLVYPPENGPLIEAMVALARFHGRLAGEGEHKPSPGLARRLELVESLLSGGFDVLKAAIPDDPRHSQTELAGLAMRWLQGARSLAPLVINPLAWAAIRTIRAQPCLRDARPEHFLFQRLSPGPRLTGLVDFGAMDVDGVSGDIARLFSEWRVREPALRELALEAYGQIQRLDPDQIALIPVFEQSAALLGGERWIRWHFLENRRFDDLRAAAQGLARALERLQWLAREVLGP